MGQKSETQKKQIESTRKRKGEPKKNNHYGEKVEII